MASVALLPQDGGTGLAVLALTGPAPVRNVLGPCWWSGTATCLCEPQSTFALFLQRWGCAPARRSLCQPVPWPGRLCLWLPPLQNHPRAAWLWHSLEKRRGGSGWAAPMRHRGSRCFRVKLGGAGLCFVTRAFGVEKEEFYSARKLVCSFTLNSGRVDSAWCFSPKITPA